MKFSRQPVEISSERAASYPNGAAIDAIEYCRGQLSAMAYVSPTSAREVSFQRLRNAFERAGIADKLQYSLRVLDLIREAQKLGNGYWFPTPLRLVPIDGQAIIVGPASTSELQHHFHGVVRAGYARVLPHSSAQGLPIQELDNWLGLHVQNSVVWSESQITEAQKAFGATISPGNVQFFNVGTTWSTFGNIAVPTWTDIPTPSIHLKGVVLCRERLGRNSFRYFFGKMEGRSLVAEAPIPFDVARLCFGFAALVGTPITIIIFSRTDESIIYTPGNLPRPERQLILALGTRDMSPPGKAYRVRNNKFIPQINERLKRLGCEVRNING